MPRGFIRSARNRDKSSRPTALVELQGVHWSVSAGGPSSVIRGAAIALAVGADE